MSGEERTCPCGCPRDMHLGEVGCPCGLPDEPPCSPADTASTGADVEALDELAALELAEEIWEDEPTDAEQLLMQRVLTSDWLAAHDAAMAERVRRETAEGIAAAIEADANGPRPGSTNHRAYAGHFASIAREQAR